MSTPRQKPRTILRLLRRVLVLLLVTYGVWLTACSALETKLVYPRSFAGPPMQDSLIPRDVEQLWIDTDAGRTEAWFIPSRSVRPMPCVVFFHGNAELIDHNYQLAEQYRDRGFSTLLVEYRGYGRSSGTPSQTAIVADAVKFVDSIKDKAGVDPSRLFYHGRSLGTGVAAQVAKERPPAALILESPFTSIASFAKSYGVPSFLVRNSYRTDRVLPTLACPILILHSRGDEIVPFSHGERLKALVPTATLIELTGGHNTPLGEQEAYWESIDAMLKPLL
ncbi:MAG TPA: alpha/beta fold hydrolase [Phycisphaerales bacterium]|nr:alpha/beta fold hydrolase [Phycisphaerales bacterium]